MSHNYTRCFSGYKFYLDGEDTDFNIEDIARGLSMVNRYNGQTIRPYSVAEHSVLVTCRLPPELQMIGLLHDASEAYIIDMPKPHKDFLPDYMHWEEKTQNRIWRGFGMDPEEVDRVYSRVKKVDTELLFLEGPYLLPEGEKDFGPVQPDIEDKIFCLPWQDARLAFLNAYSLLKDGKYFTGPLSRHDMNLLLRGPF